MRAKIAQALAPWLFFNPKGCKREQLFLQKQAANISALLLPRASCEQPRQAGRVALMVPICFPQRIILSSLIVAIPLQNQLFPCVPVPKGSATATSLGTSSNLPSVCTPWPPPGRNLPRNLPTFILLALLSVYHLFISVVFRLTAWMEEAANFDMNSINPHNRLWLKLSYTSFGGSQNTKNFKQYL